MLSIITPSIQNEDKKKSVYFVITLIISLIVVFSILFIAIKNYYLNKMNHYYQNNIYTTLEQIIKNDEKIIAEKQKELEKKIQYTNDVSRLFLFNKKENIDTVVVNSTQQQYLKHAEHPEFRSLFTMKNIKSTFSHKKIYFFCYDQCFISYHFNFTISNDDFHSFYIKPLSFNHLNEEKYTLFITNKNIKSSLAQVLNAPQKELLTQLLNQYTLESLVKQYKTIKKNDHHISVITTKYQDYYFIFLIENKEIQFNQLKILLFLMFIFNLFIIFIIYYKTTKITNKKDLEHHLSTLDMNERFNALSYEHKKELLSYLQSNYIHTITAQPNLNMLQKYIEHKRKLPFIPFAIYIIQIDNLDKLYYKLHYLEVYKILKKISKKIEQIKNQDQTLSLYHIDEYQFLLLHDNVFEIQQIHDTINALENNLNKTIRWKAFQFKLHYYMSIIVENDAKFNYSDILKKIKITTKNAEEKRSHIQFFTPNMLTYAFNDIHLDSQFEHAQENNELQAYYQPIYRLSDHKVIGFEAFIRWLHPKKGLLLPHEFLNYISYDPQKRAISQFIIEKTMQFIQKINKKTKKKNYYCAINLFPFELYDNKTIDYIKKMATQYHIDLEQIVIEISENHFISNTQDMLDVLLYCQQLNIQLALDDFGTGFTSFNDLRQLPIQIIKIDKTFTQDIHNEKTQKIIKHMVHLANDCNISMIAEGVETKLEEAQLKKINCHQVQGFLYSKPKESQNIIKMVNTSTIA